MTILSRHAHFLFNYNTVVDKKYTFLPTTANLLNEINYLTHIAADSYRLYLTITFTAFVPVRTM